MQKTRLTNFGNIGYRPMNSQYIGIGPQKLYRSISNKSSIDVTPHFIQLFFSDEIEIKPEL